MIGVAGTLGGARELERRWLPEAVSARSALGRAGDGWRPGDVIVASSGMGPGPLAGIVARAERAEAWVIVVGDDDRRRSSLAWLTAEQAEPVRLRRWTERVRALAARLTAQGERLSRERGRQQQLEAIAAERAALERVREEARRLPPGRQPPAMRRAVDRDDALAAELAADMAGRHAAYAAERARLEAEARQRRGDQRVR